MPLELDMEAYIEIALETYSETTMGMGMEVGI